MSFDIYVQSFRDGKAAGVGLEILHDAFGKYVIEVDEDYWQVQYGADESSDIFLQALVNDPSSIHTISIHRPCRDSRLWQSLWQLLELPGTVLYYPACEAPMTRDVLAGLAMPPDMRESLGEPCLVSGAAEIFQRIENA